MHDVAHMLKIHHRSVSDFECGRLHGVSGAALAKLNALNKVWTLEDYEHGTNGIEPTWPANNHSFGISA